MADVNGRGRLNGQKERLTTHFVRALASDFEDHGVDAIARVRADDPATYLRVIASIVPKDLNVNTTIFDGRNDAELADDLAAVRAALDRAAARAGGGDLAGASPQGSA